MKVPSVEFTPKISFLQKLSGKNFIFEPIGSAPKIRFSLIMGQQCMDLIGLFAFQAKTNQIPIRPRVCRWVVRAQHCVISGFSAVSTSAEIGADLFGCCDAFSAFQFATKLCPSTGRWPCSWTYAITWGKILCHCIKITITVQGGAYEVIEWVVQLQFKSHKRAVFIPAIEKCTKGLLLLV